MQSCPESGSHHGDVWPRGRNVPFGKYELFGGLVEDIIATQW